MIKAKVNVETAKRSYKPGEAINEQLPAADVAFLKKYGFVTEEPDIMPDPPNGGSADGDGNRGGMEYMEETALKKLNKDELIEYARSIGLTITADMLKNDMVDTILNYIGESMAEAE